MSISLAQAQYQAAETQYQEALNAAEEARKVLAAKEDELASLKATADSSAVEKQSLQEQVSDLKGQVQAAEAAREAERRAQVEATAGLRTEVEALQGDVARVTKLYEQVGAPVPAVRNQEEHHIRLK